MYPSLYNGRACSLLKPQLSTVHHGAKESQAPRTNILTAVLDTCNERRRKRKRELIVLVCEGVRECMTL